MLQVRSVAAGIPVRRLTAFNVKPFGSAGGRSMVASPDGGDCSWTDGPPTRCWAACSRSRLSLPIPAVSSPSKAGNEACAERVGPCSSASVAAAPSRSRRAS
jgi:hypothetical protein